MFENFYVIIALNKLSPLWLLKFPWNPSNPIFALIIVSKNSLKLSSFFVLVLAIVVHLFSSEYVFKKPVVKLTDLV